MRKMLMGATLGLAIPAFGADVNDDPHLWLEDVEGEAALDWVRERNDASSGQISASPQFDEMKDRLLSIYDSDDRIPYVGERNGMYYNFWRDAEHVRGIWRRTTLDSYRTDAPEWETVLDLDALGKAEDENWVWKGSRCLAPEYRRCLLQLSRGGADATVVREYDLVDGAFVDGGFELPEAKTRVGWLDMDTLIVGTDFGEGSLTSSGYPRVVKLWKRGTDLSDAETVFEGEVEDVSVSGWHDSTPGYERSFVARAPTFYTNEAFWIRKGKLVQIDKPDDAEFNVHREWILFELRSDWEYGGTTYKASSLVVSLFDKWMKGKGKLEVLFEPTERTSLSGYSVTRNHLILNILDNVRNRLEVLTPGKKGWSRGEIPGLPKNGTLSVWAVDDRTSDAYWLSVSGYLTPSSLGYGVIGEGEPQILKRLPAMFDTTGLQVQQHMATSKDGTQVPYFLVSREDVPLDGTTPTLLYGYGGFEVSLLPSYTASVGSTWLERGGAYVVANIRGGGEFGPRWHQAALKDKRHRAYEDFIAVGEDLVSRKITSTPHLGIMGGSNGGLLMGNMYAMRPDLWGAIVCRVPLLDMRRYHTLLAGASWMGEYGDPDDPEQWAFIQTFSPYHLVSEDVDYPPMLITTSTRDDRVHPGHARKMAARLQGWDKDVLYYENIEGGHGGAANNEQAAFMGALAWSWLWDVIGPEQAAEDTGDAEAAE
jgi:prolyl oligopeptidase